MNQPPDDATDRPLFAEDTDLASNSTSQSNRKSLRSSETPPRWRRPEGVAPGTWDYVHQRSIADHYDSFVADSPLCRFDDGLLREVLPGPGSEQSEVVLDLGCGSGRLALPLATRGYTVVGVDLSQRMLEVMAGKTLEVDRRVLPLRANLVQLDCLADHCAEHAICMFSTLGMIQGRWNRRRLLRHAARLVRPGGSFVLHVHHRWAAIREHRGIGGLLQSWWRSLRSPDVEFGDTTYAYRGLDQMFMHRYSRRELLADLAHSGWRVVKVWPVSIDGSDVAARGRIPGGFTVLSHRDLESRESSLLD